MTPQQQKELERLFYTENGFNREDIPELTKEVLVWIDTHTKQVVREAEESKNQAYKERDMLVCALSKVFPSHLCRHPDEDKNWENDWRWIVCVHIQVNELAIFGDAINDLPIGDDRKRLVEKQLTWHIHDSERKMFNHLEVEDNHWDGHTTEEKYQRLATLHVKSKKQ
jgi:hypothetical protein